MPDYLSNYIDQINKSKYIERMIYDEAKQHIIMYVSMSDCVDVIMNITSLLVCES